MNPSYYARWARIHAAMLVGYCVLLAATGALGVLISIAISAVGVAMNVRSYVQAVATFSVREAKE